MKAFVFIAILIFLRSNLFAQYTNDRQNTPEDYELAGVDSIFTYDSIPGKPLKLERIEVLDVKGNIVKVIKEKDNELTVNYYNLNNQIISSYFYSALFNNGIQRLIWIDTFEYNEKGQQTLYVQHDIMSNYMNADVKKFIYKNDTLWKTKLYFLDKLSSIVFYYHDELGRIKKEVSLNEYSMTDSTVFEYNEKGLLVDYKSYSLKYSKNLNHHRYEWNSNGKKSTFLVFNKSNQLTMRYEFKYNSKNLLILDKYTSLDADDGGIKKGESIYTVYRYNYRKH